jgi:hypothetical protein
MDLILIFERIYIPMAAVFDRTPWVLACCRARIQCKSVEVFDLRFSDRRCVRVEPYTSTNLEFRARDLPLVWVPRLLVL